MSALQTLKYAEYSEADYFAEWCGNNLVHSKDRWAGKPVIWEGWQLDVWEELMACDENEVPYWRSCALVVPRKNGKTLMLAALALYRLINDEDEPEILLAAATDKQAGRLFEACISFLRKNPDLNEQVHRREYLGEIVNPYTGGKIIRLPSSGETLDGYNPSLAICDELHAWNTTTRRRVWTSLNTGDGARERFQIITITTAGAAADRQTGILGQMIDANEKDGDCQKEKGLTISRNHEARTMVFNYSAPTFDPKDVDSMKLANPASWITKEYLHKKAVNPELKDSEVLQLHGCVWAEAVQVWIAREKWERCRVPDIIIPDGAEVYVGVDVGITHDSCAISVVWPEAPDSFMLKTTVWSTLKQVAAHVLVPGARMELELLEDHIRFLGQKYEVVEVAYDPRFFERSAQALAEEFVVVQMSQNSGPMYDAYQSFYQGIEEARLHHDGDGILNSHLFATAAQKTDRGWKISKIRSSHRIDAVPASAMAFYRAEFAEDVGGGAVYGDDEEEEQAA